MYRTFDTGLQRLRFHELYEYWCFFIWSNILLHVYTLQFIRKKINCLFIFVNINNNKQAILLLHLKYIIKFKGISTEQ